MMNSRPTTVQYNDWHKVELPPLSAFTPTLPVSVIIPAWQTPADVLARTLATLEGQTYPRDLFEVVVVDDGSRPPLALPPGATPLNVRVVHQEHGGIARARNSGSRVAAYDILLFLDSDMLVEADWITAHARWHHAVSDALTIGIYARVDIDGIDAETLRSRTGSLEDLLSNRPASPPLLESHLDRTHDLRSKSDDLFQAASGNICGIRKDFYWLVGGHDESFIRYGPEDVEFAYRVGIRGGLLVPVRESLAWHQGRDEPGYAKARRARSQFGKAAHLIAHPLFRRSHPGRSFAVPEHAVTIDAGHCSAQQIIGATERILDDCTRDLVVRIEMRASDDGDRLGDLQDEFGADPRVRVAPDRSSLADFPTTPFHVSLPVAAFARNVIHRLRVELGDAVSAIAILPGGAKASITRAWALHRAQRCGGSPADFGEARAISLATLHPQRASWLVAGDFAKLRRWIGRAQTIHFSQGAGALLQWLASEVRWRAYARQRAGWWHFRRWVCRQWARAKSAGQLRQNRSVPPVRSQQRMAPTFDLQVYNPIGWKREVHNEVGALGPLEWLPAGCEARRVIGRRDLCGLRRVHHLEDTQAFHVDVVKRAGELTRLAAAGVIVHLEDDDQDLPILLGADLHRLMTADVQGLDVDAREMLSIRMRRAALKQHSFWAVARRNAPPGAPKLPLVSILLATRRPRFLPWALAAVAAQTYPELELVLALHGGPFTEVEHRVAELPYPTKVVQVPAGEPLGVVLNAATQASSGTLLAKMDDDDAYGANHVWDLVLAHEYSRAQLVGKSIEYIYLAASDRTLLWRNGDNERYRVFLPAGGASLIARRDLDRVGGWRKAPRGVDKTLMEDVLRTGGSVYRTHGAGFLLVRHGLRHTWTDRNGDDAFLLARADRVWAGWNPAVADIETSGLAHPTQVHTTSL